MKLKYLSWILVLFVLVLSCHAKVEFYLGDVVIESMSARIDLEGGASAEYVFLNGYRNDEEIFISGDQLSYITIDGERKEVPFAFKLEKGSSKKIDVTYSFDVIKDGLNEYNFNPRITIDGKVYPRPVLAYGLEVILPLGVNNLINPPDGYLIKEVGENKVYSWEVDDAYLSSFKFVWSDLKADIVLDKEVSLDDDILNVELRIENKGDDDLDDILLRDYFFPTKYEAVSPLEDFDYYIPAEGEVSNEEIIWSRKISLESGESKIIKYSVRDLDRKGAAALNPTPAYVTGMLVATSNQVIIEGERKDPTSLIVDSISIQKGDLVYDNETGYLKERSRLSIEEESSSSDSEEAILAAPSEVPGSTLFEKILFIAILIILLVSFGYLFFSRRSKPGYVMRGDRFEK